MNASDIDVIVLTRYWPNALSVIRSLGSAGFTVDLISSMSEPGAAAVAESSKYVRRSAETICKNAKQNDDPHLLDAILAFADTSEYGSKPVLFPTDDYTASFADRHGSTLKDFFVMPSAGDGSPGSITALMNKETQSALAAEAGLLCPRQWKVSLEGAITIPDDMVYPCFVKPLDSVSGAKGEMAKCDTPENLASHLKKLSAKDPARSVLVQEYLDIEGEIDLSGISIMGEDGSLEVIVPAIIRKSRVAAYERGVTVAGTIHPAEELGENVLKGIERMIRSSGYRGIFDLELNIAGGRMWFGELNLRSGGPNYAYYLSGINLPALVAKDLAGLPIEDDEKKAAKYGLSFVYEKVLWKEYMTGKITKAEMDNMIEKADCGFIENDDDPVPYEVFMKKTAEEMRARRNKRIKRRLKRLLSPFRRR